MKYIAKKDTWFKEGTEVKFVEDFSGNGIKMGLFEGTFVINDEKWLKVKQHWNKNKVGDEVVDREVCNYDEFDIIE